ncbi:hypothetical protein HMPREF9538_01703 [Klebsiella sp. MS 92-3]|nr:hypothetical protein HMPREF9538_01703 [Klebsiella sp. MS 92-3]
MHNLHSSLTIPITSFSITGFILLFYWQDALSTIIYPCISALSG